MDEHTVTDRYRYLTIRISESELQDLRDWANEHHALLQDLAKKTLMEAVAS